MHMTPNGGITQSGEYRSLLGKNTDANAERRIVRRMANRRFGPEAQLARSERASRARGRCVTVPAD